jgi:hypothetical protein
LASCNAAANTLALGELHGLEVHRMRGIREGLD